MDPVVVLTYIIPNAHETQVSLPEMLKFSSFSPNCGEKGLV